MTRPVSVCHFSGYCKFGNFRENFIFANSKKRYICDIKNSRLRHDLPSLVKDRMISLFREGFIFTKRRILAKIKPLRKFPNLRYSCYRLSRTWVLDI